MMSSTQHARGSSEIPRDRVKIAAPRKAIKPRFWNCMTPPQFIAKWKRANLSERSAAQQHFLDLCELLGQPKPAAADPDGAWYTFERGVHKTGGERWRVFPAAAET